MSEDIKKKRGRPVKKGSMRNQYRLRLDDDMVSRLNNISRLTGKTQADYLREAFDRCEREDNLKYKNRFEVSEDDYLYDEYDSYYNEEEGDEYDEYG